MSDITKQALEAAHAHILDAYRIWQADDISAIPPSGSSACKALALISAALSVPIDPKAEVEPVWRDGIPSKPWSDEWFIAETTYGDRVVLTALPEEWAYDFKTADDTYIKADRVKRWMQFPDSQYIAPALSSKMTPEQAARVLYDNWERFDDMPTPARELAANGHFFSALRVIFEPNADLRKPPAPASPSIVAPVGVPEGWQVVPKEPTGDQYEAVWDLREIERSTTTMQPDWTWTCNQIYTRMVAASPKPAHSEVVSADEAWQELCDREDRTSPAEYPDMCLITREELAGFMLATAPALTQAEKAGVGDGEAWPTEAVCRLIHDHAGTKDADEPLHHPAQESWEEPSLKRWEQWVYLSEEIRELVAPALAAQGDDAQEGTR